MPGETRCFLRLRASNLSKTAPSSAAIGCLTPQKQLATARAALARGAGASPAVSRKRKYTSAFVHSSRRMSCKWAASGLEVLKTPDVRRVSTASCTTVWSAPTASDTIVSTRALLALKFSLIRFPDAAWACGSAVGGSRPAVAPGLIHKRAKGVARSMLSSALGTCRPCWRS